MFRRAEIRAAEGAAIRYSVFSSLISGLGLISFFQARSLGNVSTVAPILGMAPLSATLFTSGLLREVEVVTRVALGAALIVLGGGVVSL